MSVRLPSILVLLVSLLAGVARADSDPTPRLAAGALGSNLAVDGSLDESAWPGAAAIPALTRLRALQEA